MAEPTLALSVYDLAAEVGTYLGYGPGADNLPGATTYQGSAWDATQAQRVRSCVASGLDRFYHPEPTAPGEQPYEWSFLLPVATLLLPQGGQEVPLPDDFGGLDG